MSQTTSDIAKVYNIALDLCTKVSDSAAELVDGDTENYLVITLTDNGTAVNLDDYTVNAVFTHNRGVYMQSSADQDGYVSISDNVVTIHLHTDSFAPENVLCELRISNAEQKLISTTARFSLFCRPAATSAVKSDSKLSMLSGLLARTEGALNTSSAISLTLQSKADTSTLNAISQTLQSKADASAVNTINHTLQSKADASALTSLQPKNNYYINKSVTTDLFVSDSTYADYPYKADVPCTGVTVDTFATVTFDVSEATCGNYAPVTLTGDGFVRVYAKSVPEDDFTIPVIKAEVIA